MPPGWYGFGTAVEKWNGDIDELREMYRSWAFFRSVALQPRHGARQDRSRHRLALRRAGGRLDPLNHLHVELPRRYRADGGDERLLRAIHLTINGVAAGRRNSG